MTKPWWKSLSIWGAVIAAVARVVAPHLDPSIDPATVDAVGTAIGGVMAVVGVRKAIAKNGAGQ